MTSVTPTIEVCYARTHHAWRAVLPWRAGLTLKQALHESGFFAAYPDWDGAAAGVGVDGKLAHWDDPVAAGVRIEAYRPLDFDPMVSRRRRAEHRARGEQPRARALKHKSQ
jgi:putative ubiquitin-RnfH superfamily antitoxin RatB of RatAB toxin-antitoxin module